MAKTKFMTGDTVWYFSRIEQELRPALVDDILEFENGSYCFCSLLNGNDKKVIQVTFSDDEIYRTPEDFIKKIESQKFEDDLSELAGKLDGCYMEPSINEH